MNDSATYTIEEHNAATGEVCTFTRNGQLMTREDATATADRLALMNVDENRTYRVVDTRAVTRAALDYLPVALRAAERNPDNDALWAESVRAQRAIIAAADATCSEATAADIQGLVGRLADLAVCTPVYPVLTFEKCERVKGRIMELSAKR